MKALYMKPGEAAEIIDADDFEEILEGEVEYLWPYEDAEEICMVVRTDRDELQPNRELEDYGMTRGPILFIGSHDDFDDIDDDDVTFIECRASLAEDEYDEIDPFDEDMAEDDEDYCGINIVGEDEFYESIKGEYL